MTKNTNNKDVTKIEKDVLLKTINLSKSFGKKVVFNKINFEIKKGDKIALIGVNGCGKTTLTEILLGLKSPTKGKIIYDINKRDFLLNTQVVYQVGEYPRKLLVKNVIKLYENLFSLKTNANKIDHLMKVLQIYELKNQKVNKLSFGQRKKLEAVLMLSMPGRFCIVDELTAGVDINGRIELFRLFQELYEKNKQQTTIWITHDMEEISLCNRIILISRREKAIVFDDTVKAAEKKWGSIKNMIIKYIDREIGKI